MDERFYGRRQFAYINGVRYAVGMTRYERLGPGESVTEFARRVDYLVRVAVADGATDVQTEEEYRSGRLIGCLLSWSHPPVLAPAGQDWISHTRIDGQRSTN